MNEIHFFSSIALGISTAYIFLILYLLSHKPPKKYPLSSLPKLSILVAIRNEAANIKACCETLDKLNYPKEKLEILILDDQSSDNSRQIVNEFIADKKIFKIISIESELNGLRAKMNALAQGIQKSHGEIIFITDADCRPSVGWLQTMLQYFDSSTALISGFTLLENENNMFNMLQKIDWIFLQGLAFSTSNTLKPITVMGNNIAFRRNIYDSLGGFESIGFSITEDHALMKAILTKTNKTVKYILDPKGIVFSLPVDSFKRFLQQRIRWVKGGLKGSWFAYLVVGLSFFARISIVALFALEQWNFISATSIGLILGIDYFQLKQRLKDLNLEQLRNQFLKYELFSIIYPIFLLLMLPFSKRISWKGRKL